MGTSAISSFSTSDITALQNDVNELNTKLNALIVEFNKCSDDTTTNKGKIDTLITDMTGVKNKITSGYTASQTTGTGSASDSILERLSDLDEDYKNLSDDVDGLMTGGRTVSRGSGGAADLRSIDITAASTSSTGTGDDTSVNTTSSSVTGSYGAAETKVITIGAKGEVRARRLARQTLNRLRK